MTLTTLPAIAKHETADFHLVSYIEHKGLGTADIQPGEPGKRVFIVTMTPGADFNATRAEFLGSDFYRFCLVGDGLRKRMGVVPRG